MLALRRFSFLQSCGGRRPGRVRSILPSAFRPSLVQDSGAASFSRQDRPLRQSGPVELDCQRIAAIRVFAALASPQAAASKWVNQEVDWFLRNRTPDKVSDRDHRRAGCMECGRFGDFDWSHTTALPKVLQGAFHLEPLYVDLSWAHETAVPARRQVSRRHPGLGRAACTDGPKMNWIARTCGNIAAP